MLALLKLRLLEVVKAVAPLFVAVCVLQVILVGASAWLFFQFLAGSTLAILGMVLLFTGIDLGILPMGRFIGLAAVAPADSTAVPANAIPLCPRNSRLVVCMAGDFSSSNHAVRPATRPSAGLGPQTKTRGPVS